MDHSPCFLFHRIQLRDVCPANKQNDLEGLVRSLKGDETKIREQISEWWENPTTSAPEEWNAVQKQKPPRRSTGGRGGRGGRGRGSADRKRGYNKKNQAQNIDSEGGTSPTKRGAAEAKDPDANNTKTPAPATTQPEVAPLPVTEPVPPPSPSPVVPTPQPPKPLPTSGNVWATRGSAHIIQAEKPKPKIAAPITPHIPEMAPVPPASPKREIPAPIEAPQQTEQTSLPPMEAIATSMDQPPSIDVPVEVPAIDVPLEVPMQPPIEVHAPMPAPASSWEEKKQESLVSPPDEKKKHGTVLNMGRWETNDGADSVDFAFGSFGDDNGPEAPAPPEPARPPPGLSMPPMPTNAVSVSDLENKLEEVIIQDKPAPAVPTSHPQEIPYSTATNSTASTTTASSSYGVTSGSYNYSNPSTNSFLGSKTPFNSTTSVTPAPSEVQPVPVPPAYGNPIYYQQPIPHMSHHQPAYNHAAYGYHGQIPGHQFPGYHPPNYTAYDDANAAAGNSNQYQKNLRGRNNQANNNYQNYGQPHPHAYMPYDPVRYQDPYHPQQSQQQQQQPQNQSSYFPDQQHPPPHDSYKKKGRLNQFRPPAGGPLSQQPGFLHDPQQDWQSGGGAWASSGGPSGWHGGGGTK